MKKILTKLGYIAFGSLLTLIGYHFGNIDNNSVDAQVIVRKVVPIVDEIRCRNLVVVGDDDTPRVALGTNDADRGAISIYNEDEMLRIFIGLAADDDVGLLRMKAKESSGKTTVQLGTDNNGGYMALWNHILDTPVLQTSVTEKGGGSISIWDEVGSSIWSRGPQEAFGIRSKARD